ncbi:hypothetical protein TREMEDRAFT_59498 [Tremella mesenterica DSM 1558]|uniref:uncharacterized protein n=1 Tax=Tremella mesenterica (strain ATCC 24925 / CBS 8224 / DSM 1558 / NBRC 9311 / NRRL Y-6157 / RJB 2259-6 / UBC 559-6) TaxID=578456 RepID=UPI0003F49444|nr:uncharacterized protein TREMEDRAFT_59498 [Tremella mesenterica DSM 1558]EIW73331.1 hypothetical protein TREMEDRAFT_59498 [Tremella mesenterica DSM 1558]
MSLAVRLTLENTNTIFQLSTFIGDDRILIQNRFQITPHGLLSGRPITWDQSFVEFSPSQGNDMIDLQCRMERSLLDSYCTALDSQAKAILSRAAARASTTQGQAQTTEHLTHDFTLHEFQAMQKLSKQTQDIAQALSTHQKHLDYSLQGYTNVVMFDLSLPEYVSEDEVDEESS